MRLADDERGRVPFALIGVLLLVSTVAVATVEFDERRVDRDAALAGDRAEAAFETTLRDAVRDAGASAAANPVVTPAETEYGRILDRERPYRSYLELLVAIELRERLDRTPQRVGNATARVALPPIEDPDSARRAMEAVTIEATEVGVVEATVRDVPIVVERHGRTVARRQRTVSVNVSTPTLTLHDSAAEYQARLDGATLDDGTLNEALTGGLWALAWARGYAQYAGVPFENVVTNDHVELLTNHALLDVQRATFGQADRRGERRLAHRTAEVAGNELMGMSVDAFAAAALPVNASAPGTPEVETPEPESQTVGVNVTADRAAADLIDPYDAFAGSGPGGIPVPVAPDPGGEDALVPIDVPGRHVAIYDYRRVLRTAASIDARLVTRRTPGQERLVETDPPAGEHWSRGRVLTTGEPTVASVEEESAPLPSAPPGWTTRRTAERRVELTRTDTVRYEHEETGETRRVEERYRWQVDVGLALVTRPVQRDWIPAAAGPDSDAPMASRLADRAAGTLLADQGGVDAVAGDVARERSIRRDVVESPENVDAIAETAYGDVIDIRESVRTISTTTSTAHPFTDDAPVAELASTVRNRSARYRSVPARYDDLDHRARVTLRSVYVDRVRFRLDQRAGGSDAFRKDISDAVDGVATLGAAGLSDFFQTGMDYSRPKPATYETPDPHPNLSITVDAEPSYLRTTEVTATRVEPPREPYRPLGARTTTIDGLPTDAIVEKVMETIAEVMGEENEEKAPLPVAARTLRSAEQVDETNATAQGLVRPRRHLREDVAEGLRDLEDQTAEILAEETALDPAAAEDVVDEAGGPYGGPGSTVLAYTDGSVPARIGRLAAAREAVDPQAADRAETLIRDHVQEYLAAKDSQVKLDKVESVAGPTREVMREGVQRVVDRANERGEELARKQILKRTGFGVWPSRGFPVAPVPSWWIVTANVWHVEVHGTYASFVVRAEQGGPRGGSDVSYVRDGSVVRVDVDGDGTPERLGSSDRVQFVASSTVAVAVPRGGGGVGNNGTGFRSATEGWSEERRNAIACEDGVGQPSDGEFTFCGAEVTG